MEFGVTPDLVAALYEAALEPEGLRPLLKLVGNYLGNSEMAARLSEDLLLSDAAFNLDMAASPNNRNDRPQEDVADRNAIDRPDLDIAVAKATHSLSAILPHFRRALLLRSRLKQEPSVSRSLAFSAVSFGALICDRQGRVQHANAAAECLAQSGMGITIRPKDRSITAVNPSDAGKLTQLIQAAAVTHRSGGLVLTDRHGTACLMVLSTPLQAAEAPHTQPGPVLLALRQIDGSPAFGLARLTELFRLSPAQSTLAMGLYEGKSFDEIAAERGVKVTTLRTHFAEVLSRTGSKSLRDLVRLLGSIPPLR